MSKEKFPVPHTSRQNANGLIAHPYSHVGGGGPGVARRPGNIGNGGDTSDFVHEAPALRHAVPFFELFSVRKKRLSSAGKKSSTKTKPSTNKDIELSFVGDWPSEWEKQKKSDTEILDSVGANGEDRRGPNEWSPSTNDFLRFAKTGHRSEDPQPETVTDLSGLLYKIGKRKPGTVNRVYLFTHADETYLGLSGTVKLDSPYFTGQGITDDDIFEAKEDNKSFRTKNMTQAQGFAEDITLARVRDAFQKDAQIVIFACHFGLNPAYIEKLSKLFGVKVRGFTKAIAYTLYTYDGRRIINRTYGFDEGDALKNKNSPRYSTFRKMIEFAVPLDPKH